MMKLANGRVDISLSLASRAPLLDGRPLPAHASTEPQPAGRHSTTKPAVEDILDIIAHGISAAAAGVGVRRSKLRIRLGWAVFFGVVPDLVTFTIPACLRVFWWATGASPSLLPTPDGPHFEWVWSVYNAAHSLVVFAVVFGGLWVVARRPVLEALGWLLHILLDIFTHRGIFAVQFLWPASSAHLDGTPWETPWLLAATYATLAVAGLLLWRGRRSPHVSSSGSVRNH